MRAERGILRPRRGASGGSSIAASRTNPAWVAPAGGGAAILPTRSRA